MSKKRKPTTDAVEIMHRRYFEGKPEMLAALEEARANEKSSQKSMNSATKAGLTQRQLAQLVGTTPSVFACLKTRTQGPFVGMLRRIATALTGAWKSGSSRQQMGGAP